MVMYPYTDPCSCGVTRYYDFDVLKAETLYQHGDNPEASIVIPVKSIRMGEPHPYVVWLDRIHTYQTNPEPARESP